MGSAFDMLGTRPAVERAVYQRAEDPIPNSRAQVINAKDLQTSLGLGKRVFTGGDFSVSLTNANHPEDSAGRTELGRSLRRWTSK